jgi:crotonobetainyl-CoA:carnitine CoA-transferase CaiB-like acyl-CoA transferase
VIAVITDNFWQNLKQVVQIDSLDKPQYDTQPGRFKDQHFINATLNDILSTQSSSHWLGLLEAARIPCAPVNKFSQALSDPQVLHRNMVVELSDPQGHKTKGPGNPIKFSRSNEESFSAAPALGQHTDQVLCNLLDMSAQQVSELRDAEVIG